MENSNNFIYFQTFLSNILERESSRLKDEDGKK